jgi:hypothetical protein
MGITEIDYRTVPASRRMAVFPALDGNDLERLNSLFDGNGPMTERTFFEILGLTPPGYTSDDEKFSSYSDHIARHETYLRVAAAEEKVLILAEFAEEKEMMAAGQKVAWVDVGWALSSIKSLNEILEADIPAFCVGSHDGVSDSISHDGYLFTRNQPEEVSTTIMSGVELVELIFSSPSHSTVRLDKVDGKIVPVVKGKDLNERIRDGYLTEIWKGALAFVEAARDLMPGIDQEDLRKYNQSAFSSLCGEPFVRQYSALGQIPHDRLVGSVAWGAISDHWKPTKYKDDERTNQIFSSLVDLQKSLEMARRRPQNLLKDLFVYRALRFLSKLSPPLPSQTAQRFARSAAKRNPRR